MRTKLYIFRLGPIFDIEQVTWRWKCTEAAHHTQILSPRKLHPVLRAERAEKDWFATGQKNIFLDV